MRRLSALMTALLLLVFMSCSVCADNNVSITVHDNTEYAVFYLKYAGTVTSLAITSPDGVRFDASSAGTAYRTSEGRIQIGIRYAQAGRWEYEIIGEPGDAFKMGYSTDPSYGDFAGDPPPVPPDTTAPPTPAPTPTPTPAPTPTQTPPPETTFPPATEPPVPTQSETSPVVVPMPTATPRPTEPPDPTTETTTDETSTETTDKPTATPMPTETTRAPTNGSILSVQPSKDPSIPSSESEKVNVAIPHDNDFLSILLLVIFFLIAIILFVFLYRKRKYILLRFRHYFAVRRISRETKRKYREELIARALEKRQEQLKAREELIKAQMERIEQERIERKTQHEVDIALRQANLLSHEKAQEKKAQEKLALRIEQAKDREAARLSTKAKQIEEKSAKQIARDTKKIEALKRTPITKPSPIRMSKLAFSLPFLKRKKQPRESRFFLFQPLNNHCSFDDYLCSFSEPLHWSWNEDLVLHKIKSDPNLRLSAGDVLVLSRNEDISAYCVVPTGGLIPCPEFGTQRIAQLLDEEDPSHGINR